MSRPSNVDGCIRVASVPRAHPYVLHLSHPTRDDGVRRLPDPTDPWWPSPMLDPAWVREHADDFDLLHVHFGYDAVAPEVLECLGDELARLGKPLVITVHDLRNPHHLTPDLHERQLGALLEHATEVITLTDGAARQILGCFRRSAEVIGHPHIVELDDMRRRQRHGRADSHVVGLHFKSLRPNMLTTDVLDAVVEGVRRTDRGQLRVDVHLDVARPSGARHDPVLMGRLHELTAAGALELRTHDCFDDDQFIDYLASLRVSVLPYRFGTHSGWLEACRDLGVAVVAPDCGVYADQGAEHIFRSNELEGFHAGSCADAVEAALRAEPPAPIPWWRRAAERRRIAERHAEIYRRSLIAIERTGRRRSGRASSA